MSTPIEHVWHPNEAAFFHEMVKQGERQQMKLHVPCWLGPTPSKPAGSAHGEKTVESILQKIIHNIMLGNDQYSAICLRDPARLTYTFNSWDVAAELLYEFRRILHVVDRDAAAKFKNKPDRGYTNLFVNFNGPVATEVRFCTYWQFLKDMLTTPKYNILQGCPCGQKCSACQRLQAEMAAINKALEEIIPAASILSSPKADSDVRSVIASEYKHIEKFQPNIHVTGEDLDILSAKSCSYVNAYNAETAMETLWAEAARSDQKVQSTKVVEQDIARASAVHLNKIARPWQEEVNDMMKSFHDSRRVKEMTYQR